jgi:hypothetical protein
MQATKSGTDLLRDAVKKLLAEGKGWATIAQMATDMALTQSREIPRPQPARFTRD